MKIFAVLILLILSLSLFSQKIEIIAEETQDGYRILADNDEYCPVSIELSFKLVNLKSTVENNAVIVIPAKSKKNILTELLIIKKNKKVKLSYETKINLGDHTKNKYDNDFEYYLPFMKGESYFLHQGYNGSFSHKNENALDFSMPVGTKVHASRGGIVVEIVQKNNKSCPQIKCTEYNNYIMIYHSDGTFAEYGHIKKNGAKVKIGDEIEIGQFIGYSGNVGYSSGPHLHFVVFLQNMRDRKTLETKFLTGRGEKAELLDEKQEYKREY